MRELAGLRVCFIAGTLGRGGAERQLYYMLSALRQHGAEPHVLCLTRGEFWEAPIRALGVPVRWVGRHRSKLLRLRHIVAEARACRPTVLQSQHFYTNMYAALAGRAVGAAEIGALRNDAVSEVKANRGILGAASLRLPRVVAANSRAAIENAVGMGLSRERLHLLPNVVDVQQFPVRPCGPEAPVTLMLVGRLAPQKRVDRFLRLLAAVRCRSGVPVRGVIVGDGPLRGDMERQARELSLGPDVLEMHGEQADMCRWYHRADALVLSSDYEGTPNVVLEAMACGLPVLATRVGGVPDLIDDGTTGYLVDPDDEHALVDAAVRLVEDGDVRATFGRQARAFIEQHYALPRLAEELRTLYSMVLPCAHA